MFFELMMDTPNLEELQLLMDSIGDDDVTLIARFLELIESSLPERLFVRVKLLVFNSFHLREYICHCPPANS